MSSKISVYFSPEKFIAVSNGAILPGRQEGGKTYEVYKL